MQSIIDKLKEAFEKLKAAIDPAAASDRLHVLAGEVHDAAVQAIAEAHAGIERVKQWGAQIDGKIAEAEQRAIAFEERLRRVETHPALSVPPQAQPAPPPEAPPAAASTEPQAPQTDAQKAPS